MKKYKYKKPALTLIDIQTEDVIRTSPVCSTDEVCVDCPTVKGSLDLSSL